MDTNEFKVGDRVSVVHNGMHSEGTLRFIGTSSFAAGEQIGVELDQSENGSNDGKVDSVSYFECPPGTGVFVRRDAVARQSDQLTDSATSVANTRQTENTTASTTICAANSGIASLLFETEFRCKELYALLVSPSSRKANGSASKLPNAKGTTTAVSTAFATFT
ncbi:CAP-GLY domain-containing linker protein 3, partial [Physocladia obscura]